MQLKRLLVCCGLLLGLLGTTALGATFTDVPEDHWAYEYVEQAVELSLISGTSATTFSPDNMVTYGEDGAYDQNTGANRRD